MQSVGMFQGLMLEQQHPYTPPQSLLLVRWVRAHFQPGPQAAFPSRDVLSQEISRGRRSASCHTLQQYRSLCSVLSPQNYITFNFFSLPVISPFLTLNLHQVSLPSRTPLTAPNLTLPLASLVHSSAHHLAITSTAVPEETCNLQMPNLEGKKPEAITCYSLFHCLNYFFFNSSRRATISPSVVAYPSRQLRTTQLLAHPTAGQGRGSEG